MRSTNPKRLEDRASFFRALADPTRLRLLNLLSEGEVCVCFLSEALGVVQPKVSRHLAYLRREGLVTARREGKWMHYGWARHPEPLIRNLMDGLHDSMARDPASIQERQVLKKLCCKVAKRNENAR
jgi:ArsR family transcriptional regulator, arsenate/arsenite/antimonite-responsive transcriptional repressor